MDDSSRQNNWVDTTDCLEAVGVFKGWKNFLFVILVVCLLLQQISFWLVNFNIVRSIEPPPAVETVVQPAAPVAAPLQSPAVVSPNISQQEQKIIQQPAQQIQQPAAQPAAAPSVAPQSVPAPSPSPQPAQPSPKQAKPAPGPNTPPTVPTPTQKTPEPNAHTQVLSQPKKITASLWPLAILADTNAINSEQHSQNTAVPFTVTKKQITSLIKLVNFVLIIVSLMYCLTMLFALKISMLGRLGGINHIARAFFLSLAVLILILPWQLLFNGMAVGCIFTPTELFDSCAAAASSSYKAYSVTLLYIRFSVLWLLVLLLTILAQIRSIRWAKTTLKRLEII